MWLFLGAGEKARPVVGGHQETRDCDKCGQTTVFYEQELTNTIELYFVKVFAFAPKNVMRCGACGATFATGEAPKSSFAEQQSGTVAGAIGAAAQRAKAAFEDGTVEARVERASQGLKDATDAVTDWWKRRG